MSKKWILPRFSEEDITKILEQEARAFRDEMERNQREYFAARKLAAKGSRSGTCVFTVEPCTRGQIWELRRKYEGFYDLQMSLLKQFPREAGRMGDERTLPFMPGPVNHVNESISEDHLVNLESYLQILIGQPAHISRSAIVANVIALRRGGKIAKPV